MKATSIVLTLLLVIGWRRLRHRPGGDGTVPPSAAIVI